MTFVFGRDCKHGLAESLHRVELTRQSHNLAGQRAPLPTHHLPCVLWQIDPAKTVPSAEEMSSRRLFDLHIGGQISDITKLLVNNVFVWIWMWSQYLLFVTVHTIRDKVCNPGKLDRGSFSRCRFEDFVSSRQMSSRKETKNGSDKQIGFAFVWFLAGKTISCAAL